MTGNVSRATREKVGRESGVSGEGWGGVGHSIGKKGSGEMEGWCWVRGRRKEGRGRGETDRQTD